MEGQAEVVDGDEGWDDIYASNASHGKLQPGTTDSTSAPVANGTLPIEPPTTDETTPQLKEQDKMDTVDDAPLVAETATPMAGLDEQTQQVLDETSTIGTKDLDSGQMDVSSAPAEPAALDNSLKPMSTDNTLAGDFIEAGVRQKDDPQAEWQLDSSDDDSDSDTSSSDDSEDDSEDEYSMLDPITAARMLMAGDGDEDEGNQKGKASGAEHQPRTTNEVKEDIAPRPELDITPAMQITALGKIEGIIENNILIRGHTSGEYQVLEPGSVLCTHDRKVVGVVADLFGRVQQPMYSVMFNTSQQELVAELQLVTGTELFYVNDHSKFVFTQPLRNMKGTDASNIHDEEVGEDEIEFSDDEKEAEYKRQKKLAKKAGRGGLSRGAFNEGERLDTRQHASYDDSVSYSRGNDAPSTSYGGGLNYDDDGANDGFYQPLKRPDNLAALMSAPPGRRDQAMRGRGRGRGDRGRGRGDRGRGRGGQRTYDSRDTDTAAAPSAPPQSAPPSQGYAAAPVQYAAPQQTYQFNGYTFQYGNGQAPPPGYQAPPQYPHYQQAPQAASYANPAQYQAYPQAAYPQQAAYSQYARTTPVQPTQPTYPAQAQQAGQLTPAQQQNLAEVMRRLGGYPPS